MCRSGCSASCEQRETVIASFSQAVSLTGPGLMAQPPMASAYFRDGTPTTDLPNDYEAGCSYGREQYCRQAFNVSLTLFLSFFVVVTVSGGLVK